MSLIDLMSELLNKDRLKYLMIIEDSDGGIKSIDISRIILESVNITDPKEIKKENIKVNKRVRKLVDMGILSSKDGKYDINSLGYLLLDSWGELEEKKETLEKFSVFFDTHYVEDIPSEFLRQIYRVKRAKLTINPVQWMNLVMEYMKKIERKFYNCTEYLHDIPEDMIQKKEAGEIEITILYQFKNYPELNYEDEKEIFERLFNANVELRYLTLKGRHPIGIRIVDEKWATFGLARKTDGVLDRDQTMTGNDCDFISWCRDLMYHMWHFEARCLDWNKVIPKGK